MSSSPDLQSSSSAAHEAANPSYRPYHPRWYRKPYPILWWLEKLAYKKFMLRELTSLAVAYAAVLLMVQISALSRGAAAYERFETVLRSPLALLFHTIVLLLLLFHSITWLNLAPKALVVRLGRRRIPNRAVLAGHYFGWLAATVLLFFFLVGS